MARRHRFTKNLAIAALSFVLIGLFSVASHAQLRRGYTIEVTDSYVPDELLIKYKPGMSSRDLSARSASYRLEQIRQFKNPKNLNFHAATKVDMGQWQQIRVNAGRDLKAVRDALAMDPAIETVEFNYVLRAQVIPDDPLFDQLWGMNNVGQTGGEFDADIDAPEAWEVQTGGSEVIVGVIDSGVDYMHPDLQANMWVNEGEIPDNGIDDDDNGYIDDVYGYDFANNDGDPMDDQGHGTHVAGTIAAVGNNGIGVAGVSWNARIMALKFLDAGGGGSTAAAISAITYATDMGANLTNNSWGGGGFSDALEEAIEAAGAAGKLFVAAAGNANIDNDLSAFYPASYDADNIISVAALDHSDERAFFSNYGLTSVDIAAPGVDILSTAASVADPSGYELNSGTSMASPHVAGAAALLISQFPELSYLDIKARLLNTARPVASMDGLIVTGGSLNLVGALDDDMVAPAAVTDLSLDDVGALSISLSWTASGDDGMTGNASYYDVRYSTSPIDEENFDAAPSIPVIATAAPGETQFGQISGMSPETTYYVALKAADGVNNKSLISNVIVATTATLNVVYENPLDDISDWDIAGTEGPEGLLWHLSSHRVSSPETALYYGVESTLTYETGAQNAGTATSPAIDLTNYKDALLRFSHFLETEAFSPYDTATVSVSIDGGLTWNLVFSDAIGTGGEMITLPIDISAFAGNVIQLRFGFDTLDSVLNGFEGWVVDDIEVSGTPIGPQASIGGPYAGSVGEVISFDASGSTSGAGITYLWDFGDGTVVATDSPFADHSYPYAGLYTVTLEVQAPGGVTASAAAPVSVNVSYSESFDEGIPDFWESTIASFLVPYPGLFDTAELDGDIVMSTGIENAPVQSHYVGGLPVDIAGGFEYTGRMRTLSESGEIGVTFFSKYPEEYGFYTLRSRGGFDDFKVDAQGTLVYGDKSSGLSPADVGYEWVRFRVQVFNTGEATEIKAKVWQDLTPEPEDWQINAFDDAEWRITDGTFGVWGDGTGAKYWDDLAVEGMGDLPVAAIVPDVIGLSQAQAELTLLEDAGLTVPYVVYAYNNSGVPAGVVFDQVPAAGELSFEGQTAKVWVSLGPLFYFEIPDVLGFSLADAEVNIVDAGFTVGSIAEIYSSVVPVGNVIAQDPSPGLYVTEGSPVHLAISLGAEPLN